MATRWNMNGFIKRNQARYGWREITCPHTNKNRRVVTCTKWNESIVDGEFVNQIETFNTCYDYDKCNKHDCPYSGKSVDIIF